jgi:hypothetical protein
LLTFLHTQVWKTKMPAHQTKRHQYKYIYRKGLE